MVVIDFLLMPRSGRSNKSASRADGIKHGRIRYPMAGTCANTDSYLEETTIEFPPSATHWHLPPDVRIEHGPLRYEALWRQQGQSVQVRREFVAHYAATLCGAEEELSWDAVLPVMRRDLRGQVFVR